ncbi:metallophosphoesterase [Pedobacter sp. JCM 36344]|uniref:metallophosphoesterase n=1 Tax=Pedobacter sp. JCM 36344 TaxID=3374280 RepID=UPI003979D117
MRRLLQKLFSGTVIRLANKYSSRPDALRVHEALTALYNRIQQQPGVRGLILDLKHTDKIIILSDQHKGTRNNSDDFSSSEPSYLAALHYYNEQEYIYCNLGDSEELWKNQLFGVLSSNTATFEAEKCFIQRKAFIKIFGNHDLYWDNDPLAWFQLNRIYGENLKVYEGAIFRFSIANTPLSIFLTHGHQGDLQSDGNWFSKWFVSNVWAPFQSFLSINPNTPAYDNQLKSAHNSIMYSWTAKQSNLALITGHTHQPVFNSLTHLERVYLKLDEARINGDKTTTQALEAELLAGKVSGESSPRIDNSKNTYFNSGCCCYSDGDITGIEIGEGMIRLIKWKTNEGDTRRILLEEASLELLLDSKLNP